MKKLIILSLFAIGALQLQAQTTLQELLASVQKNNPSIVTASKNLLTTNESLRMGRNPVDPELEYSRMFGSENTNEVTLKQSFDFPTVYRQRNNVAKFGSQKAEAEFMAIRQTIFSDVTSRYVELVALNNELTVAKNRLENAKRIKEFFEKKLSLGETTILERNKVSALYINSRSAVTMLEISIRNISNELTQMNGGVTVSIKTITYPDFKSIEDVLNVDRIIGESYSMQALKIDSMIANSQLKLSKQEWIPSISLGYKTEFTKSTFNSGIVAGISIPLWQKRGNVRHAKAYKSLSQASYNELYTSQRTELQNLVSSIMSYRLIIDEYSQYLRESRNEELLIKALESGTISMTDYLVELSLIYDTVDLANEAQKSMYAAKAQLTKFLR